MSRVYVGIGSNINRELNIREAIRELKNKFGDLVISTVYESPAYGFKGDNFYNLVVGFDTGLSVEELIRTLHAIEYKFGRQHKQEHFTSRMLDLDLLLYNDLVRHDEECDLPRDDIEKYAFALCPLAEIAGDYQHPETGKRLADMWEEFTGDDQKLWPVKLSLNNKMS